MVFTSNSWLKLMGRLLRLYAESGLQALVRRSRLLPKPLAELESLIPTIADRFFDESIAEWERPVERRPSTVKHPTKYRVGMTPGCVQSLTFPDVNRDTVDCLLANGCEVFTPRRVACCGSLHGHNGELETVKELARRNAAGCGSHLKHYDRLLAADPQYAERAKDWSRKVRARNLVLRFGGHL